MYATGCNTYVFFLLAFLCSIVTLTSVTVLLYSEELLQKASLVQMSGPKKQAIKYKDLVKQHNILAKDVFRTQVNICNGAFMRKVNGF